MDAVAGVVEVLRDAVSVEDACRTDVALTVQSVHTLQRVADVARNSKNQEHDNERQQHACAGRLRVLVADAASAALVAPPGERFCRDEQRFRQERGVRHDDVDGDVDDGERVETRMALSHGAAAASATARARRADRQTEVDVDDDGGRHEQKGDHLGAKRRAHVRGALRPTGGDVAIGGEGNDEPCGEEGAGAVDERDELTRRPAGVRVDPEHPQPVYRHRQQEDRVGGR